MHSINYGKYISHYINSWLEIYPWNFHLQFSETRESLLWASHRGFWHKNEVHFYGSQTLTSMITLHRKVDPSMEFYGGSMDIHGVPWRFYGTPRNSIEFHGISMKFCGPSMEFHGPSMELHGAPWILNGITWTFHRVPWNSIEFHGIPWSSMGLFYTGSLLFFNINGIDHLWIWPCFWQPCIACISSYR